MPSAALWLPGRSNLLRQSVIVLRQIEIYQDCLAVYVDQPESIRMRVYHLAQPLSRVNRQYLFPQAQVQNDRMAIPAIVVRDHNKRSVLDVGVYDPIDDLGLNLRLIDQRDQTSLRVQRLSFDSAFYRSAHSELVVGVMYDADRTVA